MSSDPWVIDDEDRYSRLRLIAWWEQSKLAAAKVLVVGAGALGNEVLKNLALVGVGTLYVVDCDLIEPTNLTRSILYRHEDCGQSKAHVAARMMRQLNPDIVVHALHGDVIADVGLGLFRDVDLVIACLDNREARLWVNRQCWKVSRPWIDGGIQEIHGVVKVFTPPGSACYECVMTENDYRLINLRYSCPLLRREDLLAGKVPTAPTIASVIGGLQSQEALKMLHGIETMPGEALVFNGTTNQLYRTKFPFRDDCLSHETWEEIHELPRSHQHTVSELLDEVSEHFRRYAEELVLDRDVVIELECEPCDFRRDVLDTTYRVAATDSDCPHCGQPARPRTTHRIGRDSPLVHQRLADLGIPTYDVLRVHGEFGEARILLAADRHHAMTPEIVERRAPADGNQSPVEAQRENSNETDESAQPSWPTGSLRPGGSGSVPDFPDSPDR